MNVQTILPYVQLLVSCGTFLGMLYALKRFIDKPHDDLVKRVNNLEVEVDKIEDSLKMGNDHFRELTSTTEILLNSVLALIEFEIQYCYTENKPISNSLESAKSNLNLFLAKQNH